MSRVNQMTPKEDRHLRNMTTTARHVSNLESWEYIQRRAVIEYATTPLALLEANYTDALAFARSIVKGKAPINNPTHHSELAHNRLLVLFRATETYPDLDSLKANSGGAYAMRLAMSYEEIRDATRRTLNLIQPKRASRNEKSNRVSESGTVAVGE